MYIYMYVCVQGHEPLITEYPTTTYATMFFVYFGLEIRNPSSIIECQKRNLQKKRKNMEIQSLPKRKLKINAYS